MTLTSVVALTACGGGSKSSTGSTDPTTEATTTTTYSPPSWLTPLNADTNAIGSLMQRMTDAFGNGDLSVTDSLCQTGEGEMAGWRATLATIDNPSVSAPYRQALDVVQQTFVDCDNANWTGMLRDVNDQAPYVQQATSAIQAIPQG
jgi:hypothetical protein